MTLTRDQAVELARDNRQKIVSDWCAAAFGIDHATSLPQRGIRLLEEAVELAQACGCSTDMAHKLIDFVFSRPIGKIEQELGGVGVTLLALASAAGHSADGEEAAEVARVLAKPPSYFTARNEAKNAAGFNVASPPASPVAQEDELVVRFLDELQRLSDSMFADKKLSYSTVLTAKNQIIKLYADLARVTALLSDMDWDAAYCCAMIPCTPETEARSEAIETAAIARHAASTATEKD